jgi:multimeric flavodoxin WrbA
MWERIHQKNVPFAEPERPNSNSSRNRDLFMKVLAIYGSPRKEGNTSLLLRQLVKGLKEKGAETTEVEICDLTINPCVADYSCAETGECFLEDDMQDIYQHFIDHDCIVVAAPIFFYNVNAQTKILIDRSQALWARKYMLKQPLSSTGKKKKGVFISVGATKGSKLFDGTLLTIKYFFDAIDATLYKSLLFKNVDAAGDIQKHPTALKEAYDLGQELAVE